MSNLIQPNRILICATLFLALSGAAAAQIAPAESGGKLEPLLERVKRDPSDAGAHQELAEEYLRLHKSGLALDHLEKAVALQPERLAPGNAYRMRCIALKEFDRPIAFLEEQVEKHPDSPALRLNLAFAYVDKMPTRGTIGQGLLSRKSISQFEEVLETDPDNWLALFGKAMNNLHWPRIFNRLPDAVEGFRRCLEIQQQAPSPSPHFALTYLVLGDALTLQGDLPKARQVWSEGARLFPKHSELRERLAQGDGQIVEHVRERRNLALRINTDLSGIEEEAS